MSNNPIKVGFVGLSTQGWASTTLAPSLLAPSLNGKYILTAVSTSSEESATATAKKYSEETGRTVKAFWGDTSKIANDPEVDFVIVSVKSTEHKNALDPVIAAGKPFFVEWPGGKGLEESKAIAEAAKANNLRGFVGLQGRQSLVVKKVKEILASGKIGQIRSTHLIALFPGDYGYWGPKIIERAVYAAPWESGSTGPHIGGGHILGPFLSVLGNFSTIASTAFTAYTTPQVIGKDGKPTGQTVNSSGLDHLAFSGRLQSGALASVAWRTGQRSTPGRTRLFWEIDGEEGTIRIDSQVPIGAYINLAEPNLYLNGEKIEVKDEGATANLTRAWEEYAKGETGDYATLEDAVKIHRVLDAVKRSAEGGVTVTLH